jgi:hypothetical protein
MARTATKPQNTQVAKHSDGPAVHHMVRALADEPGEGQFTYDQLDAHCQTWLDQGYKLQSVHPTYIRPEQGPGGMIVTMPRWDILYIFVRE